MARMSAIRQYNDIFPLENFSEYINCTATWVNLQIQLIYCNKYHGICHLFFIIYFVNISMRIGIVGSV